MLELIDRCYKLTNGLFDPTIDKISKLWSQHLKEGKIPTDSEINSIKGVSSFVILSYYQVGWTNIQWKDGKVKKTDSNTSIDLGGIAKGYCVDKLLERIHDAGYSDVFVDWGSEIRVIGQVTCIFRACII